MGIGQEKSIVEIGFNITEIDRETLKISPVKRESEKVEEGVEAILAEKVELSKTAKQKNKTEITKLPIRRKLLKDEETTASQEELFNHSDIQKAMAVKQAKEDEIQGDKLIGEFEKLAQIPFTETETKTKLTRLQDNSLPSKKLVIGAVLLASVIYLQYGGIAALLFVCALICLGAAYSYVSKKSNSSTPEVKEPGSFITESEVLKKGKVWQFCY